MPDDAQIMRMLSEAPNPSKLNFTMFLTLFGDKMTGYDPEDVIKNAFAYFDPEGKGKIDEDKSVNATQTSFSPPQREGGREGG